MVDLFLVIFPFALLLAGKGYLHLRSIIVAHLSLSSLLYVVPDFFGAIDSLDPGFYYMNMILALGLSFLACCRYTKHTKSACYTFVLTAIVSFLVYVEYYIDQDVIYDRYSYFMILLSAWQIFLLIRIGNVGTTIKRWATFLVGRNLRHNRNFSGIHAIVRPREDEI